LMRVHMLHKLIERQRSAETVALDFVAAMLAQKLELLLGLHAFGYGGRQLKGSRAEIHVRNNC
jgi:hypothetical protein